MKGRYSSILLHQMTRNLCYILSVMLFLSSRVEKLIFIYNVLILYTNQNPILHVPRIYLFFPWSIFICFLLLMPNVWNYQLFNLAITIILKKKFYMFFSGVVILPFFMVDKFHLLNLNFCPAMEFLSFQLSNIFLIVHLLYELCKTSFSVFFLI